MDEKVWFEKGTLYIGGDIDPSTTSFVARICAKGAKVRRLVFNSVGGADVEGFALYDLIRTHYPKAEAFAVGSCESAALLPFLACEKRSMTENAVLMIHHGAATLVRLHQREFVNQAKEIDRADKRYMQIVAARTGLTKKKILAMAKFGRYLTADQAVAASFAHRIVRRVNKSKG